MCLFVSLQALARACYACLPLLFDRLSYDFCFANDGTSLRSIVLIVSPLTSLMQDQVRSFEGRGLTAAFVGSYQKDASVRGGVTDGEYQLVYVSPDTLVSYTLWRAMIQTVLSATSCVLGCGRGSFSG